MKKELNFADYRNVCRHRIIREIIIPAFVWYFQRRFSTPSSTSESDFVTQKVWNLTRFCLKCYLREILNFCTCKNALSYITYTAIKFDKIFGFWFKTEVKLTVYVFTTWITLYGQQAKYFADQQVKCLNLLPLVLTRSSSVLIET